MVVARLQKGHQASPICIFCTLRPQAPAQKPRSFWRSLKTTAHTRRPSQNAVIQERDTRWNDYERTARNGRQQPSNSQNPEDTKNRIDNLFPSSSASRRAPAVPSSLFRRQSETTTASSRGSGSQDFNGRVRAQSHNQGYSINKADMRIWSNTSRRIGSRDNQRQRDSSFRDSGAGDPITRDDPPEWGHLRRKVRPVFSRKPDEFPRDGAQREELDNWRAQSRDRGFVSLQQNGPRANRAEAGLEQGFQVATQDKDSGTALNEPLPIPDTDFTSASTFDFRPEPSAPQPRTRASKGSSRREQYDLLLANSAESRTSEKRGQKGRPRSARLRDEDDEDERSGRYEVDDEDFVSAREEKKERKRLRRQEKALEKSKSSGNRIILPEFISIANLASALRVRVEEFADKLANLGFEDFSNSFIIDGETAGLIASEFNFDPIVPGKGSEDDLVAPPIPEDTSLLMPRPPIITIMGHVDHGKTTLLDWLRQSSVAASEHGGITQHIGAFTVPMPSGRLITFLDTPGHAAFLDMRARGANVTDIVILVVAADDSVKPQTIEAIKHAKAAKVPIIVAINKMDKEDADPERVKQDLARHGVEVEDFGGDTQTVCVSGKTGMGMEELEESAIALADVLDVKADTTGQVEGWVIEATSKKSGKVATVLVKRGTLHVGDVVVAGKTWTRARTLRNEAGVLVESAPPGTPVEVDGWREQPDAGSEVLQAPDEQRARRAVAVRIERADTEKLAEDVIAMNEARRAEEAKREREKAERVRAAEEGESSTRQEVQKPPSSVPGFTAVPFVLRADVSGSVEALQASVLTLGNSEVRPSILRAAFGPLSPTDVELAATAGGHVISFNMPVDPNIMRMAEKAGVKVLDSSIIYRLTDEVKSVLEEKLPPLITSRVTGEAEIAQVFEISLKGKKKLPVAGCKVRNGVMTKGSKVKLLRDKEVIYDGLLTSLKNVKKDANEMRKGTECGMGFQDFEAFLVGDQVQCYENIEEKRKLY